MNAKDTVKQKIIIKFFLVIFAATTVFGASYYLVGKMIDRQEKSRTVFENESEEVKQQSGQHLPEKKWPQADEEIIDNQTDIIKKRMG